MRKKLTISKLKKKAWGFFSKYIRLKYANNGGYCQCITCGTWHHYKEVNAGHYIHGNTKMTYFDERNVHCQCVKCNKWLSGNSTQYALYLEVKYGPGILQELGLKGTSRSTGFRRGELEFIIEEYKEKANKMKAGGGLK